MTDINVLQYDLPPSGSLDLPMVHTLCPLSVSSLPPLFPSTFLCIIVKGARFWHNVFKIG